MTPSTSAARVQRSERQPIPLPQGPGNPGCPKCGGEMWDNRQSKRNPKAPDFRCRNRSCDGVLWPGQARNAIPAIPRPQLTAVRGDAAEVPTSGTSRPSDQEPPLRRKYLDLTDFALVSVRPKYTAAGLECGPETVAAIVATLYIAETRREGL